MGPSAEELESLKELIRFDHEYVKRPPIPTPVIDIDQEETASSSTKPSAPEPAEIIVIDDDEMKDFTSSDASPITMEFRTDLFSSKAGDTLQDMLVSLEDSSLSMSAKDSAVPNLLSLDDGGIFDCDLSDLHSINSDVKSCDSKSESGRSEVGSCVDSAFGETPGSPFSDNADLSPNLGDSTWEESFTDLFSSFDYL